jgi:hypothetical protein
MGGWKSQVLVFALPISRTVDGTFRPRTHSSWLDWHEVLAVGFISGWTDIESAVGFRAGWAGSTLSEVAI